MQVICKHGGRGHLAGGAPIGISSMGDSLSAEHYRNFVIICMTSRVAA